MKNYFGSLYNLDFNEDENTLYVFDSNYLSYAIQSVSNSDKYFNAVKKVIDNVYIPFIVYIESIENINKHISQTKEVLNDINSLFDQIEEIEEVFNIESKEFQEYLKKKIFGRIKGIDINSLNGNINYKGNDGANKKIDLILENIFEEVKEDLKKLNKKLLNSVQKRSHDREKYRSKVYEESIKGRLEKLNSILTKEGLVGEEYTEEDIARYKSIIPERFNNEIPPGYKDKNKDNIRKFGALEFDGSYGDAMLWLDVIEYVKGKKISNVVIVSDDMKRDWSEEHGKIIKGIKKKGELRQELKIEFLRETGIQVKSKLSSEFINDILELSDNEKESIENEITEIEKISTEIEYQDTIIVRAKKHGFNEVFLGEDSWYWVRIDKDRIPFVNYIAVYQTSPVKEITHYATIKDFETSDEDPTKKKIIFKNKATELKKHIPLGNDWNALQSNRYTNFQNLFNSKDTDDLFSKTFDSFREENSQFMSDEEDT
ncbi:PIN-like domain-containing protein [Streptococcus pacificus]|uniref:PIN like domain-containing protein n=1 Tax=Streptococcus pacificus TaxID=2740577 RepID=A0ABS0ZIM5_9STRE|nr:PIN-like domain-containing protein [Streptococcus pacificus]MBJ8325852.1 hypothetical protein [Streptococcus pacificus]